MAIPQADQCEISLDGMIPDLRGAVKTYAVIDPVAAGLFRWAVGSAPIRGRPERVSEVLYCGEPARFSAQWQTDQNVSAVRFEIPRPAPDEPFVAWIDEDPSWECDAGAAEPTPRVGIEMHRAGVWEPLLVSGGLENDEGLDFVTTLVGSFGGRSRWVSIWMVPQGVDESALLRFVVSGTSGRTFHSPEFTVKAARERWGFVGLIQ